MVSKQHSEQMVTGTAPNIFHGGFASENTCGPSN